MRNKMSSYTPDSTRELDERLTKEYLNKNKVKKVGCLIPIKYIYKRIVSQISFELVLTSFIPLTIGFKLCLKGV